MLDYSAASIEGNRKCDYASGLLTQMTETELRERLIGWLDEIKRQVEQLKVSEHLFWELQEIVNRNDNFRNASGLFTRWIADGFGQSSIIAVRRQVKVSREQHIASGVLGRGEEISRYRFASTLHESVRGKA